MNHTLQARVPSPASILPPPINNPRLTPTYPKHPLGILGKKPRVNSVHYGSASVINYCEGGSISMAVCPLPVVPSNTNRLDIGVSRALNAFNMSCANTPPTTAQTGENSCAAVVDSDLDEVYPRVGDRLSLPAIGLRKLN